MKLHNISINNLRRRKAKMAFLTIGLMVGIATIVTLVTLTNSMSGDIERKMDEFGANILITPRSNDLSMSYGGISLGGVTFDQKEIREEDLTKIKTIGNHKNISAVSPKVLGGVKVAGKDVLLVGIDFESELKMKQWWQVFGDIPKDGDELLLGSDAAKALDVTSG
ncbi:MAG TPA: ABC transporter permease, partial [Geobacteraceae bacterium]|nr:ABC transporter permease [Geobacteraceae bacterium]